MSAKINDGGPAFPRPSVYDPEDAIFCMGQSGMSLRDWFAGQAMAGITSSSGFRPSTAAKEAYAFADAMLEKRAERAPPTAQAN